MGAVLTRQAVAVGASAGGVEALTRLFRALPPGMPTPVFVVLHISPAGRSLLAPILARVTSARVVAAEDGMEVQEGAVYVAPPDRHLTVDGDRVRLTRQPRENGHRPSIDVTFRSIASAFGAGAIGVVLSGTRDDGSAGLRAIKEAGGLAFVQDPADAHYNAMPKNALGAVTPDAVLPVEQLAQRLVDVCSAKVPKNPIALNSQSSDPPRELSDPPRESRDPADPAPQLTGSSGREAGSASGAAIASRFTCPDCGGVLFETAENGIERFRCSVGHVYSADSLDEEQERALEGALWEAVRSLEDRAMMLRRLEAMAGERRQQSLQDGFGQRAADMLERSRTIRQVIERPGPGIDNDEEAADAVGSSAAGADEAR